MKFLVVGLGSMGRRRLRLLKQIDSKFSLFGVDLNRHRCNSIETEYGVKTFASLANGIESIKPDCVIVSSPPLSHAKIIKESLEYNCHVFSELNLVPDGYNENVELSKIKKKVLFLSSTSLYRDEIIYIDSLVKNTVGKFNYSYHFGQYLLDWHPWEKIEDYFVSHPKTNACREMFAIELPWLQHVFGKIASFKVCKSKNSNLSIRYPDNYMLLLEHENGNKGMLAIDVISRKAVRNLEVYSDSLFISWDGSPTGLRVYDYIHKEDEQVNLYKHIDKLDNYASFIIENEYRKELEAFISEIHGFKASKYSFLDDLEILRFIDKIEED